MREIGKGAFGTVFLVKHKGESGDVEPLVLKKVKLAGQNARERHACLREMRILSALVHPSLLGFRDAWLERGGAFTLYTPSTFSARTLLRLSLIPLESSPGALPK